MLAVALLDGLGFSVSNKYLSKLHKVSAGMKRSLSPRLIRRITQSVSEAETSQRVEELERGLKRGKHPDDELIEKEAKEKEGSRALLKQSFEALVA